MAPSSWVLIYLVVSLCFTITFSLPDYTSRIFGGNVVQPQELPFQTSIRVKNRFDVLVHICGGSILSSKLVLTAAHCTDSKRHKLEAYRVFVGDNQEFEVKRFISHPFYNSVFLKNDLVIIELAKPIEFSCNVAPIQLYRENLENGVRTFMAGWGPKKNDSEPLKIVELEIVSNEKCRSVMAELISKPPPIYDTVLCAFNTRNGEGIENGDSGSALVFNNSLVGVTTWASGFALGSPNGFQRISFFADWIDEVLESIEE